VRKLILTATGLVCLAGVSYFIGSAAGQGGKSSDDVPHKIGLIDMGQIFNEYEKLKVLREEQTAAVQESEAKAKKFVASIQTMQADMKEFKEGTPEYTAKEQQFAKLTSDFDTFRKVTQRDLLRKEAKMYHTVYLEVQDAVEKLCNYHGYTMVMRFNKEELNSTDPQKLIQGMNRPVVFHRVRDDMTNTVLKMLNQSFGKAAAPAAAGGAKKNNIKPAGAKLGE
jgi:Skp family chaperone for outer membrane proteins